MSKRRRSTLKHFFRPGALPSADQFSDLIESTVNQVDDGFDKTPEDGLKISSLGSNDALISFFRENRSKDALWTIGYDEDRDKLLFEKLDQDEKAHAVLSLSPNGNVGVNRKDPKQTLDVGGVVRANGRIGVASANLTVPADGHWHDIRTELTGCNAFEIIAGVGIPKTGRYALMHAIALNTFNPTGLLFNFFKRKNRIKCQHAYYNARGDKLQLRWENGPKKDEYRLRLRARCSYGDDPVEKKPYLIRYYITQLWFDEAMDGSSPTDGGDKEPGKRDE